jgi:phosphopentomutase
MDRINRVIVIVLDGVGAGAAPDASLYGDVCSHSLGNTARVLGGLSLPNLFALGLGNITEIEGVPPNPNSTGCYGKMQPRSAGKDTISGHWELMGIYLPKPFPTYPEGFPKEILDEFKARTGRGILGNKPASGTEIIQELGFEHIKTGKLILYTSADSVFQVAAHEEVIPVSELYSICEIAREILQGDHAVGRVIARPFLGDKPGKYWRTKNRKDFPRFPNSPTILEKLVQAGKDVYSVGKINDIFGNRGITKSNHTVTNQESICALLDFLGDAFEGLLFVNLIEFDMVYGHRNDPIGYANALREFDTCIPAIIERLRSDDMIIIAADHGVDPTTPSTDHSREYVPLLVFGPQLKRGIPLGIRDTFSDVGATIAELFSLTPPEIGESFLSAII